VHWWFVDELQILLYILPPLIAPTPFTEREKTGMNTQIAALAEDESKRPDSDINIVIMLMECVVLLCQTRVIRNILRKERVYYVCRNTDYYLENDRVNDIMHDIVNFLERDEDPYDEAIENANTTTTNTTETNSST